MVVFGRKAKKLAEELGVVPDNLRDAWTPVDIHPDLKVRGFPNLTI
ncbi:hypothetical protein [Microcoleus vaginatus]